jgi:hypothetical protein
MKGLNKLCRYKSVPLKEKFNVPVNSGELTCATERLTL